MVEAIVDNIFAMLLGVCVLFLGSIMVFGVLMLFSLLFVKPIVGGGLVIGLLLCYVLGKHVMNRM